MRMATVSWKSKIGVASSEKLEDLMTIVLSYHHSEGGREMSLLLQDS